MKYVLFVCTHNAGRSQMAQEQIRACVDRSLGVYGDAPIRSFMRTLAYRDTRECLREGRCAEVVAAG